MELERCEREQGHESAEKSKGAGINWIISWGILENLLGKNASF